MVLLFLATVCTLNWYLMTIEKCHIVLAIQITD